VKQVQGPGDFGMQLFFISKGIIIIIIIIMIMIMIIIIISALPCGRGRGGGSDAGRRPSPRAATPPALPSRSVIPA
jgi:hypothetical protein